MDELGNNETPLGRYFGWFTIALLIFVTALLFVRNLLGVSTTGIAMSAPFIAAIITSDRFVQGERRAPSEQERKQLTFGNLGITLFAFGFMALAAVTGGALHSFAEQVSAPVSTILMLAVSIMLSALVLNYVLIRWAYGSIARKRAEKLNRD